MKYYGYFGTEAYFSRNYTNRYITFRFNINESNRIGVLSEYKTFTIVFDDSGIVLYGLPINAVDDDNDWKVIYKILKG